MAKYLQQWIWYIVVILTIVFNITTQTNQQNKMKSKRSIQLDIKSNLEQIKNFSYAEQLEFKKEFQNLKNDLTMKRTALLYIEIGSTIPFLESQLQLVKNNIDCALNSWNEHRAKFAEMYNKMPIKDETNKKTQFLAKIPMAQYAEQIKFLNYLLS